jgi:glycosyltransferase involved in cell wall biosynthesis
VLDVSVIVPTHGRERLVVEAIQSALAQTGVTLEVIVLDDTQEGSARPGVEAIRDARVRYVKRSAPSRGRPAVARNEGMALARGQAVHFLDDDDLLADGALAALVEPLRRTRAGVAFAVVEAFGEDPLAVAQERDHFERAAAFGRTWAGSRWQIAREGLFGRAPVICSSCLFRRDDAIAAGGFDASIPVYEDVEFFVRVARARGATFVDHRVLHRRTGLPSLSRDASTDLTRASFGRIYASYRSHFGPAEFYALKVTAKLDALARRALRSHA